MADNYGGWSASPDPAESPELEPQESPEPDPAVSLITFEADGHPDGYAVASGAPGLSGRWVSGATRDAAVANWNALYESGALNE